MTEEARVINQQYIENHKGPYPVYSSQTTNDGIFGSIDTFDFDGRVYYVDELTARKQELFFTETENSTVQMYVEH